MFKRSRAPKSVVGLDLDPAHIAAVEVAPGGAPEVRRSAVAVLRPGVLRDGELVDPLALTEALGTLWNDHGLPRRVRVGVANQRIVMRTLDLPPMDDPKALDLAVRAQAPDHIPIPMEEAVLDHRSLGVVATGLGPRTRVVVVAARREMVERTAGAVRDAGLELEGVDLSAFAMVRALAHRRPPGGPGAVLYVNVSGLANVAVADATGCLFTRASAGGIEALAATLAERRGLTLEHARQWLVHVGLGRPLAAVEGDPDLVAAARGVLDNGVQLLADGIRSSLDFFRAQPAAAPVERGVLTGPAVAVPGFAERLGELLTLPIEPALAGDAETPDAERLTVAAGLALEG